MNLTSKQQQIFDKIKSVDADWGEKDFIKCCNNKDTLCPDGSDKSNHRQDQSVLTMLYHLYHLKYKFTMVKEWVNIDFHKGLWNHEAYF